MIVQKFINPDGSKHYQAFPTSTKELRRLFLMYGIEAWVTKYGGRYDILFAGGKNLVTENRQLPHMSLKGWLKLAQDNVPPQSLLKDDYSFMKKEWGNLKSYIEKDTVN